MQMNKGFINNWLQRENVRHLLLSFAVGFLVTALFYDIKILNIGYVKWLQQPGRDVMAHYNGWHVYQHEPWQFPLGYINGILSPFGTTVSMTDSIPLFALVFKLIRPILPYYSQYFGWFAVFCHTMQFYFALLLLKKYISGWGMYLGAGLFLISPVMAYRLFEHMALSAHFVILAAIHLFIKNEYITRHYLYWLALLITALLIHPYLMAMVYIVFCGYILNFIIIQKSIVRPILIELTHTAVVLLLAKIIGLFDSYGKADTGFGLYSVNLNALINGMGNSRLMQARTIMDGQGEGFQYMGMAIIIMAACVFMVRKGNFFFLKSKKMPGLIAITIVTLFLALTNKVMLGSKVIIEYELPQFILGFLEIFRASGRFFWILYYFLYLFVIVSFVNIFRQEDQKKRLAICMSCMLALQIYDISPLIQQKRIAISGDRYEENIYKSDFWDTLDGYFDRLIKTPYESNYYMELADIALRNNMTVNVAHTSRVDYELVHQYAYDELVKMTLGEADSRNLYLITDEILGYNPEIFQYYIVVEVDQINICIDKRNAFTEKLGDGYIIKNP